MVEQDKQAALCLAGGNALGAHQAGFCATLLAGGMRFPVIAGTSIGAVHAALIAGNPPERRIPALTAFWHAARKTAPVWPWKGMVGPGLVGRRLTLVQTLLYGHSRLFRPKVPGLLSLLAGIEVGRALFDRAPMRELLTGLVDFDRLNAGDIRLCLAAVDARSGENLCFDSKMARITLDHLMAVTAFPLLFDPVRIDGRDVLDAGLRRNLPLDLVPRLDTALPCLALDLFPLAGGVPDSLTAMAARAQDLALAGQSADALDRYPSRAHAPLVHAVPDNLPGMTATKSIDFSDAMLTARWQRGRADAEALLAKWPQIASAPRWHLQAGSLRPVSHAAGDPAVHTQALPGDIA